MDLYGIQVAAGAHADGRLELFIVGTLGNVLSSVTQLEANGNGWSKEAELKKAYAVAMEVANHADGRLELFAINPLAKALNRYTQSGAE